MGRAVLADEQRTWVYGGFGVRLVAYLVDLLWIVPLSGLLYWLGYGSEMMDPESPTRPFTELLVNLAAAAIVVAFWVKRQATPGKMLMGLRIVDASSGGPVPLGRYVVRYLGYILSGLILMLGYLWIIWDPKRQGWHDKLAGTVVVRYARGGGVPVSFRSEA
jgi:uncharacterized RDD family membrane protein YckC